MISYSFHLSSKKHALTTNGKISAVSKHNLRKYKSDEYDRENIVILQGGETNVLDDVKAIYHQEFDEAIEKYNEGKRTDRQIEDYMKYVSESGKNDVAAEIIIQIGDKEFWADKTEENKRATVPLLEEQIRRLEELAPDFKIASAVVHLDEASPHMHLVGVPVASGYKRGPSKQTAKTKVFTTETLELIQDQMHRFASQQIQFHPEIFEDEELKKIERGRNTDFSKEYYIRQKAEKIESLKEEIQEKTKELDSLQMHVNEIQDDTDMVVEKYVEAIADSEMKKDFMKYALLENPKSPLGKLISGVWKKFKEWWEKEKKPRVVEKAKESVLKKLKESKEKVEEEKGNKSKKAERSGKKLETEL